jgi:hypothetical protein
MDFTLNNMTLLALTLAVGIVIDDAIVVLENIVRYIEEKGYRPFQAAIDATREITLAVLATTLSLVIIFLPIAFMSGYARRYVNQFGWTMAFSILVSCRELHADADVRGLLAGGEGARARLEESKLWSWTAGHRRLLQWSWKPRHRDGRRRDHVPPHLPAQRDGGARRIPRRIRADHRPPQPPRGYLARRYVEGGSTWPDARPLPEVDSRTRQPRGRPVQPQPSHAPEGSRRAEEVEPRGGRRGARAAQYPNLNADHDPVHPRRGRDVLPHPGGDPGADFNRTAEIAKELAGRHGA